MILRGKEKLFYYTKLILVYFIFVLFMFECVFSFVSYNVPLLQPIDSSYFTVYLLSFYCMFKFTRRFYVFFGFLFGVYTFYQESLIFNYIDDVQYLFNNNGSALIENKYKFVTNETTNIALYSVIIYNVHRILSILMCVLFIFLLIGPITCRRPVIRNTQM